METWLDVQPLRIPRPKLLASGAESSDLRTMVEDDIMKRSDFDATNQESVRPKIPVATK